MIHHSAAITGAEPINRTNTAADENGKAQFQIGARFGAHVMAYWTVSDLIEYSARFADLAVDLLAELGPEPISDDPQDVTNQ